MDEIKHIHENSSTLLSNNKNHDSNATTSVQNSQFKAESTFISNESSELPKNFVGIQNEYSTLSNTFDDINTSMSRVSIHDTRSTCRSTSNQFRLHPSNSYHQPVRPTVYNRPRPILHQPETQAQLVAFTQPLMSIRLPHQEYPTCEQNYYPSSRPYIPNQSNEQSAVSMKYKSETTTKQSEYYVDSFPSNFSDSSSSSSNNKTRAKHVTFKEPEMVNNTLPAANPNHSTYPAPRTHMYPSPRPSHRYDNPSMYNQFYAQYSNTMMNPRMLTHSRGVNMIPTPHVWTPRSYYLDPQTSYVHHRFQTKQLYDPNKPKKTPTLSAYHNSPRIIRTIEPKDKKRTKPTNDIDNSTVPASNPMPHQITILRKPSTDTEVCTSYIPMIPMPVEDRPIHSLEEKVISSEKEQIISSSTENIADTTTDKKQLISSSIDSSLDVIVKEEQMQTQFMSNTNTLFSSHELLSILQSANCLSSLNEYAQQKKFPVTYEFSTVLPSSFACIISIDTRSFPSSTQCTSKNEAQKVACDQALRILYRESCKNEQCPLEFSHKHDYIAHRSMSAFQELNINELLLGRKTLACMLMITNEQYEQARVISIATGNSCLDETNLTYADDGTTLHDCHAEILVRRGLIRFLFEQIKQSRNNNKSSIFEYNSTSNKYELHENITFHMFISSLPCGNASFNMTSNSLRYKQGTKEGTILGSTSSSKYSIKSCSDKIYRWNILGIQGGLLINILTKPIYLDTITLACETTFDHNYVKYSLCQRLSKHLNSLPSPYVCNFPDIDCPKTKSFQQERQVAKLQTSAFAWNITVPDTMELLEPMTGRLKNDRSMSLLSKRNLFEDFTNFIQANFPNDNSLSYTTYQQAKKLNKTYVEVKDLISTVFQTEPSDTSIPWLSKSDQLEQFSME
ncbi:unnamed protein product [Rotaria magnacalcarata]|uniref:Uncharacterized protein n=3 Tax=Rotaria magnacalcarata TaxID=392030 RepID=A0A816G1N6_9BILA|nr:unnamed protein product [Rotaria magnacalcarata]CAF1668112.1 unnamed protein product [Rotaria magnacalcarata]CAF2107593.1 unnamed protein product [Rotaria magnacalcarata]CAF3827257.1 unnamed protein product [Rotaria magnacalcarata]CAF4009007.1 unnamed protein product [Rotaria magnacalcarata]